MPIMFLPPNRVCKGGKGGGARNGDRSVVNGTRIYAKDLQRDLKVLG